MAGGVASYSTEQLRFEVKYFLRRQGETVALVVPGDSKQREFTERSESVDGLRGHNLFVNLYRDLRGLSGTSHSICRGR